MYPALFSQSSIGKYALSNKVVMAPTVTKRRVNDGVQQDLMAHKRRVTDGVPNDLMVEYYSRRAGAGLIIAEGTSPVESGMGHAHMPGIYSKAQVAGWKKVTDAVHANGGKIFLQIMHTGRISHPANMPAKARIVAPSAIAANGQIWTMEHGYQPYGTPRAMTTGEVQEMVQLHVKAAKQAMEAGFDGVELHAANGYLMEQFLHPDTNQRTDKYGGSIPNRVRFILETVAAVSAAIGKDRTGIRLSPYSKVNDLQHHGQIDATYEYLVDALDTFSLSYIHVVDGHSLGEPEIPAILLAGIRARFNGPLILNGNFDALKAEDTLRSGLADFVAFEQPCNSGVKLSGPRMSADCLS